MVLDRLRGLPPLIRLEKLKELQQKITAKIKAVERNLHQIELEEKQELLEIELMINQSVKELQHQQDNPFDEPLSPDEFLHEQTKANTLTVNLPSTNTQPTTSSNQEKTKQTSQATMNANTTHTASQNLASNRTIPISSLDDLTTSHEIVPQPKQNVLKQPSQAASLNYYTALHERPSLYLREDLEQLYTQIQTRGYLLWEQQELAQNVTSALENKLQDLQSGKYIPSDPSATQEHIDVTQRIAQRILGMQPALNQPQQKDWYKGT